MSYPFGQSVRLSTGTITGDSGPTNPATLTLTITLPDASTVTKVLTDFTQDSTGLYHYDYLPTLPGDHDWRIVATTPNTAAEGVFTIAPVGAYYGDPVSLDYVKAHLNEKFTGDDAELQSVIEAAVAIAEDMIGPIAPRTVTETFDGGRTSITLSSPPILSIQSVTERTGQTIYTELVSGGGTYPTYGYQLDGSVITKQQYGYPAYFFRGVRNVTVTYTAGRTPVADKYKLGIAELVRHLWKTQQGTRSRNPDLNEYVPSRATILREVAAIFGNDGWQSQSGIA
jgi:hypothetical protein